MVISIGTSRQMLPRHIGLSSIWWGRGMHGAERSPPQSLVTLGELLRRLILTAATIEEITNPTTDQACAIRHLTILVFAHLFLSIC